MDTLAPCAIIAISAFLAILSGGLWQPSTPRAPFAGIGWVHAPDDEPPELTYVDIDIFEATF
ncbi:MAG: hypothetical protein WCJ35_11580 [Planctomycetota bacterium]